MILFCLWVLKTLIGLTVSQTYNCPAPWISFDVSCYLFDQSQRTDYINAVPLCEKYGASLVSVNSFAEHNFVVQQLRVYGIAGEHWYTSGLVNDITLNYLKWQGDGTPIGPASQWWASEEDRLTNYSRIAYRTDRYGTNLTDPNFAARGPVFTMQPQNLVVVGDSRSDDPGEAFIISLECFADGNPLPTYQVIHRLTSGSEVEITPDTDGRYTLTGGRLAINDPVEELDAGYYQWVAINEHGIAKSNTANLTFGVLGWFSNVIRAAVVVKEFESAVIECDPPTFKPDVVYQWWSGNMNDFIRPTLNDNIFMSSNGKLYFSEVFELDAGNYFCIVQLTAGPDAVMSTGQPPSRISLAIPLRVDHQVPAVWGPVIADGFIASYPKTPVRGSSVKLECLAYGTLPLAYSWSRDHYPMPDDVRFTDSNRVLEIAEVKLEDDGIYHCTVVRNSGAQVQASHHLVVETKPYFIFPLQNQHADIGGQLTWRCEAKAIPRATYTWYKDGDQLTWSADYQILSNVLTIRNLDPTKHNGVYQCSAVNLHGKAYSAAQLRVLAFAPSFHKHQLQPSQMAAVGSSITIACSPEAAPQPEYTWTRNGVNLNLPDNDDTSRVRKLANGNLLISDVQFNDQGQYGCLATNAYGSDVSYGNLHVVDRTVITVLPQNTVVRINQTSVMLCAASFPSNVDHMYAWVFNGWDIQIANHPHYRMGSTDYPGALYVSMAQYEHTGVYQCIARTTHGSVNASAHLAVEGPPGPPAGIRADISTVTSTSITLIWTEGSKHGRPVSYHSIETSTEYNSTWVSHMSNIPVTETQLLATTKHVFLVNYLKPSNSYMFRVRAVNGLGVGSASRPSGMYRIPGAAPSKYPDNVGGGGGSVGTLTITWNPLHLMDQGGSGIGYNVYWRRKGTTTKFLEAVVDGDSDSFSVTVGVNNYYLEYEVKVTALNDFGVGPESPEGVFIFSAENLPIGVATNVYAWPFNSTALYVSWQTIPNNRENMKGVLLGYQVNFKLRDVEGASLDAISWRGETDTGVVIGLDPYTWYTVDVQVLNTAGMGPRSEVFHAKTYKAAPIFYPTEVRVQSHSSESVSITWRGFSTTVNEENVEGYKVRYWQTTEDVRSAKDAVAERAETTTVVYGIKRDIVYECRVLGFSRGGDGKHSESVYFTLGGRVPFDPSSSDILAGAQSVSPNIYLCIILHFSFLVYCRIM